ncbi:MAG: S9 family peptidase, partial [Pseudomonadota bacterium]
MWRLLSLVPVALLVACSAGEEPDGQTAAAPGAVEEATMTEATEDPYLWLEDVEGERALEWVEEQNERSLGELTALSLYEDNYDKALTVLTSDARIPYGVIRDGYVYNFWQDGTHVRGILRRTPLAEYEKSEPAWETVLDVDALAASEDRNWVYKGSSCFKPKGAERTLCMISLSNGGKDAVEMREFSLVDKNFVEDGFFLPEAKQGMAWIDADTLLVATDWGNDGSTLTESGYPSDVRRWVRGQALADAEPLYAGDKTDVGVWPWASELEDGRMIYGAVEADTFFTSTYWLLQGDAPLAMPIPSKSSPGDIYTGYQFITLQEDWEIEAQGQSFKTGDLVAFELDALLESGELPPVELVFRANDRQAVNGVAVGKGAALLSINDNVASKILTLDRTDDGWQTDAVTLPGAGQASIFFADHDETT